MVVLTSRDHGNQEQCFSFFLFFFCFFSFFSLFSLSGKWEQWEKWKTLDAAYQVPIINYLKKCMIPLPKAVLVRVQDWFQWLALVWLAPMKIWFLTQIDDFPEESLRWKESTALGRPGGQWTYDSLPKSIISLRNRCPRASPHKLPDLSI